MNARSVGLISALLITLQVVLMQALRYAQGHHLAYVVLSIALLGFGAGGSVLTLWRKQNNQERAGLYAPCLLLCAIATALLPWLAQPLLAGLEVDLLHIDHSQWLRLCALGGIMFLPFFFGAMALSVAFAARAERIGRLYAANLIGSALGAGAALLLMQWQLPETCLPRLAPVAVLAALPARPRGRLLLLTCVVLVLAAVSPPRLPRSPYKDLSYALQLPRSERTGPLPHRLGRIDYVHSPALRYAPGLSLQYTGTVPSPPHVYLDGDLAGVLPKPSEPGANILAETPRALPFAAGPVSSVLCLAPGGTALLNLARRSGAAVHSVESHPLLIRYIQQMLPREHAIILRQEPRLYLEQAHDRAYDLILFPDRGAFGGPVGLQTLGEDHLFTREALAAAFARLTEHGRLGFSVWLDAPLRHAPRMADLIAQSLRDQGLEPVGDYIAAVRGWGSLSLLAGTRPFTPEARAAIRRFAEDKGFDVVWPQNATSRRHGGEDQTLDMLLAGLFGPEPEVIRADYRFDIRAPEDNRPFFNQFLRGGRRNVDLDYLSLSERGLIFLQQLAARLAVAVLLLVLLPLLPLRKYVRKDAFTLLYFSGLGAGFMLFEVALIQRFILLWGHPVTSAALVITALLCGMSLGSLCSHRLPAGAWSLSRWTAGAALLQVMLLPVLHHAMPWLLAAPAPVRFGGGLSLLVLFALPLGVPFPLGIRRLAERSPQQIPWACGIDGAVAVMAAPLAALLAFHAGFQHVALAAAAAYALAAVAACPGRR